MSRAELDQAVDWAAGEGWNPGHHDAVAFHACDPKGFVVGLIDGAPVASISVVRYPAGFAFLGFYIVAPAWRGLGHGWQLWQAGMARVADCNIGLDGVVAQQGNYRKSGFHHAWNNVRHEGVPASAPPTPGVALVDARRGGRRLLRGPEQDRQPGDRRGQESDAPDPRDRKRTPGVRREIHADDVTRFRRS